MERGKISVALIFGGASDEHDVSISSARSVYEAIDKSRYTVLPIAIDRHGNWLNDEASFALLLGKGETIPGSDKGSGAELAEKTGERYAKRTEMGYTGAGQGENTESRYGERIEAGRGVSTRRSYCKKRRIVGSPLLSQADVAFPLLHGPHGEDGTIQGYFELLGMPYVGSGVLASAVSMDKSMMREVFRCAGLPLVPYRVFTEKDVQKNIDDVMNEIESTLSYPVFIKPAGLGSSIGISKAKSRSALQESLRTALRYDRRIVVEQGIEAREIEIGMLGDDEPLYSVIGEIIPANEFYDYEAKYASSASKLIIPADLDDVQKTRITSLAVKAYRAVRARGLARVDFFLDTSKGDIYVNEINTMPGFTPKSMYPLLWQASGIGYAELIDRLITHALSS
ncbi:MAG: D-alanine--D-alanine ligase [Candidatus Carbobacillus altaicus]|nr:D-alanine--D-alanine ligase [Candidatus Carbobacillus altaicus]